MSLLRQTHTYAILEVSRESYLDITTRLRAAGHDPDIEDGAISMQGIAITPEGALEAGDFTGPAEKISNHKQE